MDLDELPGPAARGAAGLGTPTTMHEAGRRVAALIEDPERLSALAHAKRFMERFAGDATFRGALRAPGADPRAIARAAGLDVARADPLQLAPLWRDGLRAVVDAADLDPFPLAAEYGRFAAARAAWRDALRAEALLPAADPRFQAWRARQIARTESELGAANSAAITHPVVCYELSSGCSVGCWFCGLTAGRLEGVADHGDPRTRERWRAILDATARRLGPAARTGFCYWATEPLDAPGYDGFVADHWRRTGALPQTTTAVALRDPALARRLLELRRLAGGPPDRFSVLTTSILERIHATFTAEELIHVELVLQNAGSANLKANAGRARTRPEGLQAGTIACVSGFKVNLVDNTLELISPCRPTDRWPDGHRIHSRAKFGADPDDYAATLSSMIDGLLTSPSDEVPLAFRADLVVLLTDDGFDARSPVLTHRVTGGSLSRALAERVLAGATPRAAIDSLCPGGDPDRFLLVRGALQRWFDAGLLCDDPARGASTTGTQRGSSRPMAAASR